MEIVKTINTLLEENRVLDISSESSSSSVIKDDQMECIAAESCDEKGYIESLKSVSTITYFVCTAHIIVREMPGAAYILVFN